MFASRLTAWLLGLGLFGSGTALMITLVGGRLLPTTPLLTYYGYLGDGGAMFILDRGIDIPFFKTPASFVSMAWSPDSEQLAYITYEDNIYYLNTVDAAGRHARRVTEQTASTRQPVWSPDSASIAFETQLMSDSSLFLVDANGDNLHDLLGDAASSELAWSPHGTQVALARRTTAFDIFVMDAATCLSDTSNCTPKQITTNPADDRHPAWSPDGSRLAFLSNRDGTWEIYTVNSDCDQCENEVQPLTDLDVSVTTVLNWSPDGRWLVFVVSPVDSGSLIYVVDTACTDTSCATLISNKEIGSHGPVWSPNGDQIAYYRSEGTGTRIMLLDTACIVAEQDCVGRERPMSPANSMSYYPVWRPK